MPFPSSQPHGRERPFGAAHRGLSIGADSVEVAAQAFQGVPLAVDLRRRPDAETAERRNRRTPALQGMLQQKGRDERGKQEKAAIRSNAKHHARERQGGRIRLEHALYVPLFVELPEPGGDPLRMLGVERDVRLDLPLDPLCDIRRRIRLDAVCRGAR